MLRCNEAQDIMLCAHKHQNRWWTPSAGYRWQLGRKHPKKVRFAKYLSCVRHLSILIFHYNHENRSPTCSQEGSLVWRLTDQRRLGFDRPAVLHLLVKLNPVIFNISLLPLIQILPNTLLFFRVLILI